MYAEPINQAAAFRRTTLPNQAAGKLLTFLPTPRLIGHIFIAFRNRLSFHRIPKAAIVEGTPICFHLSTHPILEQALAAPVEGANLLHPILAEEKGKRLS